jgi:hypothetical protein
MASRLNPYLNFNGNARQALEFHASVFARNGTGGDCNFNGVTPDKRGDTSD